MSGDALDALEARIDGWLADEAATNEAIVAVERDEPERRRWFVRVRGEDKDVFTIWLTLGQRSFDYETYLLPAPADNHAAIYEYVLRQSRSLRGASFMIGDEDALYLHGEVPNGIVDAAELDRIIGTLYFATERYFAALARLAFPHWRPANP